MKDRIWQIIIAIGTVIGITVAIWANGQSSAERFGANAERITNLEARANQQRDILNLQGLRLTSLEVSAASVIPKIEALQKNVDLQFSEVKSEQIRMRTYIEDKVNQVVNK